MRKLFLASGRSHAVTLHKIKYHVIIVLYFPKYYAYALQQTKGESVYTDRE